MESSVHGVTARSSVYEVHGRCFESASESFADIIAAAHAARQRPRCLCQRNDHGQGIEMYVARLGDGYIVKRMPETGPWHAPDCPSYEPLPDSPGSGQALDSAIVQDPVTGETTLKLDFTLSTKGTPSPTDLWNRRGGSGGSGTSGLRLSLGDLLRYLWDEAELTRWRPGFAGKRSWATVRWHLLRAADNKLLHGQPLRSRLFIPEVFSVERRDSIDARRLSQWAPFIAGPDQPNKLMLLIGEVKKIDPIRNGFEVVIKHMPGQPFALDGALHRRVHRRFASEFDLWHKGEDMRIVALATFSVAVDGRPTIADLSPLPVTQQWLPVASHPEKHRMERLVQTGKSFVKAASSKAPAELDCRRRR